MWLLFYFLWKILLANNVDTDQMPHYVASDLGLHCLPVTLVWVPGKNKLKKVQVTGSLKQQSLFLQEMKSSLEIYTYMLCVQFLGI